MFTGDEAALPVQRKAVCANLYSVGKFARKDPFAKNREFSRGSPLHDRVERNIAEQEVSAAAQPDRSFGELEIAGDFFDLRSRRNQFVQRRIETADAFRAGGLGSEQQ
jgi:hypothetical protein